MYSELQIGCAGSANRHEVTDVLTDHEGDWHPIRAAFQTHLKRRLFLDPYRLRVTESEPKTHNKRLEGDTVHVAPGAYIGRRSYTSKRSLGLFVRISFPDLLTRIISSSLTTPTVSSIMCISNAKTNPSEISEGS